VELHSYTNKVARIMGRCELLVTKPGALTCTEAIVMNKPMVLVNTLPGQERANAAFLSGLGCAEWVKRGELAETVRYILANPEKRKQMENACGTSHMESAGEVVKILYDMVEKMDQKNI
jgi:putative glycosyltransferase